MNPQHLRAFLWLRWRLLVNQMHRGGIANVVIVSILAIGVILLAAVMAVAAFVAGLYAFDAASPNVFLYVWDVLVLTFSLWWSIGVLTELQRSEGLSLEKFLHLPVSLSGVFCLNYLSSLFSLTLFVYVPMMVGLSVGLVVSRGPVMLLLLPLVAGFFLMVTGITYQFQGWLASLMVNKRRRRTIIVFVTLFFVVVFQLPTLINLLVPWNGPQEQAAAMKKTHEDLQASLAKGDIDEAEFRKRSRDALNKAGADLHQKNKALLQTVELTAEIANLAVPIGWLPYGAMALADGSIWPAPLCALAMGLIGTASLWRAYRTSLRLYTGAFTAGRKGADASKPTVPERAPGNWLDGSVPWLSEPAAVIVLGGLRSLTRAPEAKMVLLTPLLMLLFFGGAVFREPVDMPIFVRPLIAFGALAMGFFALAQITGNQFGYDRGGFRVFVLSPTPRRDILLGKNISIVPLILLIDGIMLILVEILYPLRIDHLIALVPQWISMFLVSCMMMNFLSIFAPMRIAHGSFKPTSNRLLPALLRVLFVFLLPVALAPTLLPLGIEAGLESMEWIDRLPICLALSLVGCAIVICIYRVVLTWQGGLLQGREQAILDLVTTKSE